MLVQPRHTHNGVHYLSDELPFEKSYLAVREKEGRVHPDEFVRRLPACPRGHKFMAEWQLRQSTVRAFCRYLEGRELCHALDVGCGNAWFSAVLSREIRGDIYGLDINTKELEQGVRCFGRPGFYLCYGDLFDEAIFPPHVFDLITFNASVHYFQDFRLLMERLESYLAPGGEIHILDSPFYAGHERLAARQRSVQYYEQMKSAEMAQYFHHRCWAELEPYDFTVLYKPSANLWSRVKSRLGKISSPFPWVRIRI